jgi:hypothetical protein
VVGEHPRKHECDPPLIPIVAAFLVASMPVRLVNPIAATAALPIAVRIAAKHTATSRPKKAAQS